MMSNIAQITDFEFLGRKVEPRRHFLYAYTPGSALFRARVRQHILSFAAKAGWNRMTVWPGNSLHGTLGAPSFLDDRFYVCDASGFSLSDLDDVMAGIANDAFESHLCLMISSRSKLLERASWGHACARVGVIVEPVATIENYRSMTRQLLQMSDLPDVRCFGEDAGFLSRMKAFVKDRHGRSPFELATEIDRIILSETDDGVVRQPRQAHDDARGGGKLGELVARFLDDRTTTSFHPLLRFVGMALRSTNEPERLLLRLFSATAKIVAGSDQRYKRNREGNPAVLPYLVWGTMLVRADDVLRRGSFMVVFEQTCQAYSVAANEAAVWLVHPTKWQDVARAVRFELDDQPTALDRAREELRSAIRGRVLGSDLKELQWLLPVAANAERERLMRVGAAAA